MCDQQAVQSVMGVDYLSALFGYHRTGKCTRGEGVRYPIVLEGAEVVVDV